MATKRFSKDFERRAANARRPVLSPDLWAPGAADMVRILVFAGFDARELIVTCLKRMRGQRVSLQLVESVIDGMKHREVYNDVESDDEPKYKPTDGREV